MRIGVLIDSCCDLPKSFIEEHGIVVMPIPLPIGNSLVEDRRDPAEILAFYETHLDRKAEDFHESIPSSTEQIERLFLERLVLVSPMSKTAAVNVGPGGVSLVFTAVGQTLQ